MGAPLKVVFVNPAGAAYGSERSMLTLLRARHFEAEVVCPCGGGLERDLQELRIRVYPMEFGGCSEISQASIEATGGEDKINALEHMLEGYGIKEMVRSGRVVLVRGSRTT